MNDPTGGERAGGRRWLGAGALAVAALGLAVGWSQRVEPFAAFRFDDTYITLRYAENLAHHGRLSFNLDDRVDGYTSPAWTLWLALFTAVDLDPEETALRLAPLCGLAAIFVGVLLARSFGAPWPLAVAVAGVGPLGLPGYTLWSTPGMETPYVALVVALALLAFARSWSPWLRALAAFLCATARPETALLAAALVATDAWRVRAGAPRSIVPHASLAALLAALFVVHWIYYDAPLPNAWYAKDSGGSLLRRGLEDLAGFLRTSGLWLAPLAAVALALRRAPTAQRHVALVFAGWSVVTFATYARAGGDSMIFHRFYQPLVPAGFAFVAAGVGMALPRGRGSWARAARGAVAAGAAALLWLVHAEQGRSAFARDDGELQSSSVRLEQWRRAGDALARSYPPQTRLAIRAAGVIPWITRFPTYDTLGLNNREVARTAAIRGTIPGHQKQATPIDIVAWEPDLIVHHPVIAIRDESGSPPRWADRVQYREARYEWRCLRSAREEWICFWERPGVERLAP